MPFGSKLVGTCVVVTRYVFFVKLSIQHAVCHIILNLVGRERRE